VFEISDDSATLSGLLSTLQKIDPSQQDGLISLAFVDSCSMKRIITYLNHYNTGAPFSAISRPMYSPDLALAGVNDFDIDMIGSMSIPEVKSLLRAADYLDIPTLTDLCCAKLASYIKTIPLDQMMTDIGITSVTAEWQEAMCVKHQWCKSIQK